MSLLSEKVRDYLNEKRFAVLATLNPNGTIQQTTMWYLLEEGTDTIMMNTRVGRQKERNLRRNPHISICIEDGYRYLTLSGRVELIDDLDLGQRDIYRLAVRYDGEEAAAQQVLTAYGLQERITLHLHIEKVLDNL
jgi:PPOX class probable F420-dependent enzyme